MIITVRSDKEAEDVIRMLKNEGYEYKYSILYAQEWYKTDEGSIFIHKGY